MPEVSAALPYELRIGVTGHRHLADEPAVGRAVERLLDYVAATLKPTSAAPLAWAVISPLAKGADRLVADAVLRRPNARLEVISPLPLDDYRTDFADAADRADFERLLARASSVREPPAAHATPERAGGGVTGPERDLAYFRAGEQIVDACELLMCIWDGAPARGSGGTANIVRYALQRERTVLWIHPDRPDTPAALLTSVGSPVGTAPDALVIGTAPLPQGAKGLSRGY